MVLFATMMRWPDFVEDKKKWPFFDASLIWNGKNASTFSHLFDNFCRISPWRLHQIPWLVIRFRQFYSFIHFGCIFYVFHPSTACRVHTFAEIHSIFPTLSSLKGICLKIVQASNELCHLQSDVKQSQPNMIIALAKNFKWVFYN